MKRIIETESDYKTKSIEYEETICGKCGEQKMVIFGCVQCWNFLCIDCLRSHDNNHIMYGIKVNIRLQI